jgi:hypothetical protein
MEFSIGMDWISISGKINKTDGDTRPVGYSGIVEFALELARGFEGRLPTLNTCHAPKHYYAAFKSKETGVVYAISNDLATQGWLISASGSACRNIPSIGDIQEFLSVWKAHVTRFDFCVDIFDTDVTPVREIESFFLEHGHESEFKAKLDTSVKDGGYIRGSRESERYYRYYDKAKEQGLQVSWMRSEMEYKGDLAQWAFDGYYDLPAQMIGDTIRYLRTPDSGLVKILQEISLGAVIDRQKKPPAYHDREKWLSDTVLKAFISLCKEDGEAGMRVFELFAEEARLNQVFLP